MERNRQGAKQSAEVRVEFADFLLKLSGDGIGRAKWSSCHVAVLEQASEARRGGHRNQEGYNRKDCSNNKHTKQTVH
eukprot:5234385-Amphidinium_carterae.2